MNCIHCDEPVDPVEDQPLLHVTRNGTMFAHRHRDCAIREVIGGLNHLRGLCSCCGGSAPPDPPELTRREAARQAAQYWTAHKDEE